MLRKDYLVRMLEEMTEMIGKVFGLKQQRKWTEALWELDELYRKLFRLNSRLLGSLSAKDIVEMMRTGGTVESDKLQSLARLMKEEADVLTASGQPEEGVLRARKALHLYLAAHTYGADPGLWELHGEVSELQESLKGFRLPEDTERLLMGYEESRGNFALAENALYRLLESGSARREEGVAFYTRLLALDPGKLEEGGLPETEVREGLEAWLARTAGLAYNEVGPNGV
ncbi:DUF6483 family protein [Paenibacillus sp. alder61]|uniref:Tetratricopeptide repeat protein n=1 Tax=Paenibacillus faecis TaxID=862114 RepID=A0A5D0CK11_9BACL|nr:MULTISPECIES: DUF6483 family protein [Paenibacillus]MCA1294479.1 DUF6483 family protein [Paenibacillus sp. alder61]TYA10266.1 hypothetical protein FRY98_27180 [Paenibacillus faecis]